MSLDPKALEAAARWFDQNFNGSPDTPALVDGIVTAYLASTPDRALIEQCVKVAEDRAQTLRDYSAEAEVVGSKDDITWNLRSAELCDELADAMRALLP